MTPISLTQLHRELRGSLPTGYAIVAGIPGQHQNICSVLLREALASSTTATRQEQTIGVEEFRGGSPARRLFSQAGGAQQRGVYLSQSVRQPLAVMVGHDLAPTGQVGSYSYYLRAGDHLALHRDVVGCDLAVITCLCDTGGGASPGGTLLLYPGRNLETLGVIRATPEQGAIAVSLSPGHSLVLLGGIVPHAVSPVTEGQRRVVSLLCFQLV
jgi:hypothetical protein